MRPTLYVRHFCVRAEVDSPGCECDTDSCPVRQGCECDTDSCPVRQGCECDTDSCFVRPTFVCNSQSTTCSIFCPRRTC
ncbi:hypothetical protein T492DRAFT_999587 [Pavlovales sp. CCMP2436]|nr:hypothetical protein T492DRAFT_999587 [Pavlovales sp. CCMP2436]